MSRRRRIRILPDHVANQIAAGEVVERPASVVKELVENALDAGARAVRVSIERGGKGLVRVEDDGVGMIREDALACVDRHATSKIRRANDLRDIRTLGFRGEALPSIAAVSRTVIETQAEGDDVGTRIRLSAGRMLGCDDMPRRRGTTVDVRNLFHNTPVRARFLRSVAAETRAVAEVVHALALAHLDVRFVFRSGERVLLDLEAGQGLIPRIEAVWPDAGRAGLIDLAWKRGPLRASGAVQRPDLATPGFRRVHLFVNGRPFRDPGIVAAADRGYRTVVPDDSRPWIFLFLEAPGADVDVNVHPGKAEVRFRPDARVDAFVTESVQQALAGPESAATWDRPAKAAVREGGGAGPRAGAGPGSGGNRFRHWGDSSGPQKGPEGEPDQLRLGSIGGAPPPGQGADRDPSAPKAPRPALLQVHNAFILAETRDGLIILDQHAAHERILYERIAADSEGDGASGGGQGQRLLFPFTVRLTPAEIDLVESVRERMARLGFEFKRFGKDAILIRAVPSPHAYFDAERCVREMIDELLNGSDLMESARGESQRVAMSFACKAAIKAGQRLSDAEMHELFDQLFATRLPYHDIHGRPTVVRLGLDELRRKFGRS